MERQYRNHLSGYLHWDQLVHAEDWLLFEKNIGAYLCIDEVALSRGELYTVLTNKEAHGGKGSMIAIIKGTDVHTVTSVLLKLSRRRRYQVREITLDMAPNMGRCVKMHTFFLLRTKPRLSQAGALLLPKDFVSLGIRISL